MQLAYQRLWAVRDTTNPNAAMAAKMTGMVRTGQTHMHRDMKPLLKKIEAGEIDPSFVITQRLKLWVRVKRVAPAIDAFIEASWFTRCAVVATLVPSPTGSPGPLVGIFPDDSRDRATHTRGVKVPILE